MARYRMDDGTICDDTKARRSWQEATRFDGSNHISVATGSQWAHEQLHLSSKGRYWLESWSQWQGSVPSACRLTEAEAAEWLLANDHDIPDALASVAEAVME